MKELSRGIKINIIGNFFRFSRLGFIVLAAVLYGTEAFGVYTVAWAAAELLYRFGLLGLDHGLLFELSHFHSTGEKRKLYQKITSSLKACLGLSFLGVLALALYSHFFVDNLLIRNSLYCLLPAIPLYNVGILLIQATMGLKEMKYHAIIRSGLEPFSMIIFLLLFWKSPFSTYGVVLAQSAALVLVFFLSIFSFRRFFSIREVLQTWLRPGRYRAIIQYSLPMYIIEFVDAVMYRMDIFLISAFLGTGTPTQMKVVGVYGFAKQIARVMSQTKNAFAPIFSSVTSETYLGQRANELWDQVRYATEKLLLLNIGLALVLSSFGRDIMAIMGKDAGLIPYTTLLLLIAGQFLYSTFSLLMFFLVSTQRAKRFLYYKILILLLAIGLGSLAVIQYGPLGAAFTLGLGYAIISLAVIIETLRYYPKNFFTTHAVRILLSGATACLLVLYIKPLFPANWSPTLVMLAALFPALTCYFALAVSRDQWRGLLK